MLYYHYAVGATSKQDNILDAFEIATTKVGINNTKNNKILRQKNKAGSVQHVVKTTYDIRQELKTRNAKKATLGTK